MTDTPRVAVIGLDCGTPQLLFRDFEAETPEHPRADAARDVGRPGEHHPAHHGPRVGMRDDRQDAGTAGDLRVPQPQGHDATRACRSPPSDAIREPAVWDALGANGLRSLLIGVPPSFPAAEGVPRLAGRVLPHAAVREVVGVPGRARDRDRGRARGRATTTSSTSRTSAERGTTSLSTRCSR